MARLFPAKPNTGGTPFAQTEHFQIRRAQQKPKRTADEKKLPATRTDMAKEKSEGETFSAHTYERRSGHEKKIPLPFRIREVTERRRHWSSKNTLHKGIRPKKTREYWKRKKKKGREGSSFREEIGGRPFTLHVPGIRWGGQKSSGHR